VVGEDLASSYRLRFNLRAAKIKDEKKESILSTIPVDQRDTYNKQQRRSKPTDTIPHQTKPNPSQSSKAGGLNTERE
jgi:hypothetical protein